MLMHVEHLLVLGTIGDTSREHRAVITPSTGALLLAFARSGSDVRHSLAYGWGLEDILLRRPEDSDTVDYAALRLALISLAAAAAATDRQDARRPVQSG
jgi:hypothetical protein